MKELLFHTQLTEGDDKLIYTFRAPTSLKNQVRAKIKAAHGNDVEMTFDDITVTVYLNGVAPQDPPDSDDDVLEPPELTTTTTLPPTTTAAPTTTTTLPPTP